MSALKALKWACSILFLFVLGTPAIQPAAAASEKPYINDIQKQYEVPDALLLNIFLQSDSGRDIHIILPERDSGKKISGNDFFLTRIINFSGCPILTVPTLKRFALLIPAMNSRTIIYPFHSFM